MLYLDLETRSNIDLIFYGLSRYARHASTETICMAYAFDDDDIKFWWSDQPFPKDVQDYFNAGGEVMAHNAAFETHMFDNVIARTHIITPPNKKQWRCSMALGLANGFAGGLDALAVGLGLPYRKQSDGTRLIREYCSPGHLKTFKQGDAELMKQYNISDVQIMRAAIKCLRPFSADEWDEYHVNTIINERGLPIDVAFCTAALSYTRDVADDANKQIADLTKGVMTKASQRNARDEWLLPRLTAQQLKVLEVYRKGEKKLSLDQDHRGYLLERDDLADDVRLLLTFINNAGSSTLKKFAVAAHQHVDGRVHNTFLWNGAGRTGRFSGKGLQPHNIRRDVFDDVTAQNLIQDIIENLEIDNPATTMARLLRAMIASPKGLAWVDWSAIEGRVAPWLAKTVAGDNKLKLFKQGKDIYVVTAANMFNIPEQNVDKNFRQSGKIAELSLQFGGSHNALIGMAKNFGIDFEEEEARDIVSKWRIVNSWAGEIWAEYDRAITEAVLHPNTDSFAGRVIFHADSDNFLWCQLPSERLLAYPKPKYEQYETPWGEVRDGVTFQSHFKPAAGEPPIRIHARGALLFQNTVQGVAADCLRESVVLAHEAGLKVVGHVHDEIIIEGTAEDGERLNNIMLEQPWWADGLPLATGGVSTGLRYGK